MLQLIDWPALAFNALWITGAVIALSVVSIGQWQSRNEGLRLRSWLGRPAAQRALALSAVLFCVGMLGTSGSVLERVLWGFLAAAFALQAVAAKWPTRWPTGWPALRRNATNTASRAFQTDQDQPTAPTAPTATKQG